MMRSTHFRSFAVSSALLLAAPTSQAQTCVGATAVANLSAINIPSLAFSGQHYNVNFNLAGYHQGDPVYQLGAFAAGVAPASNCTAPSVAADLSITVPYAMIGTTPRVLKLTYAGSNNLWVGTSTAVAGNSGTPDAADPLTQLLVSSPAWCYFSFSASSGVSKKYRFAFHPSGSLLIGGNADVSFDTATGSYTGVSGPDTAVLRWFALGQILTLTGAAGSSELIVSVSDNGNGSPILNVAGSELARCQ